MAALPGGFGGLRVVQIFPEEAEARLPSGAAHQQFTGLVGGAVLSCVVDDAPIHFRRRAAKAGRAHLARFNVGDDRRGAAGFRHRPGLHQGEAEAPLEGRMVGGAHPGAEAEAHPVAGVQGVRVPLQQHGGHHA